LPHAQIFAVEAYAQDLSVQFKDVFQKFNESQTELGCERQKNSTLQAQVIQCLKTCLYPIKMVLTIISLTKNLKWKK
jgi:hypothetical protein